MTAGDLRFGRRGAMLVLFAMIYATYGVGLILAAVEGSKPRGLELLTSRIPLQTLCAAWVICGAVAAVSSLPPLPLPQWLGFTALFPMPAAWMGCYLWSWLTWLVTGTQGYPLGWVGALVWSLLVGIVGIVAGWPEAPKLAPGEQRE